MRFGGIGTERRRRRRRCTSVPEFASKGPGALSDGGIDGIGGVEPPKRVNHDPIAGDSLREAIIGHQVLGQISVRLKRKSCIRGQERGQRRLSPVSVRWRRTKSRAGNGCSDLEPDLGRNTRAGELRSGESPGGVTGPA